MSSVKCDFKDINNGKLITSRYLTVIPRKGETIQYGGPLCRVVEVTHQLSIVQSVVLTVEVIP